MTTNADLLGAKTRNCGRRKTGRQELRQFDFDRLLRQLTAERDADQRGGQ